MNEVMSATLARRLGFDPESLQWRDAWLDVWPYFDAMSPLELFVVAADESALDELWTKALRAMWLERINRPKPSYEDDYYDDYDYIDHSYANADDYFDEVAREDRGASFAYVEAEYYGFVQTYGSAYRSWTEEELNEVVFVRTD